MTLGLPIWNNRVSPVLDVASQLLIVDLQDGREVGRRVEPLPDGSPARLAATIAAWGVQTLICGAVSQALGQLLQTRGIELISQIRGDIDHVLRAYQFGQLDGSDFRMPGCRDPQLTQRLSDCEPESSELAVDEMACCEDVHTRRVTQTRPAEGDGEFVWEAMYNGRAVGRLEMVIAAQVAEIRRLEVTDAGDTTAVRCRLAQAALAHCRQQGLLKVILRAPTHSRRALRLFRCLGFQHSRSRDDGGARRMEFYLNLYQPVDEAECHAEIDRMTTDPTERY